MAYYNNWNHPPFNQQYPSHRFQSNTYTNRPPNRFMINQSTRQNSNTDNRYTSGQTSYTKQGEGDSTKDPSLSPQKTGSEKNCIPYDFSLKALYRPVATATYSVCDDDDDDDNRFAASGTKRSTTSFDKFGYEEIQKKLKTNNEDFSAGSSWEQPGTQKLHSRYKIDRRVRSTSGNPDSYVVPEVKQAGEEWNKQRGQAKSTIDLTQRQVPCVKSNKSTPHVAGKPLADSNPSVSTSDSTTEYSDKSLLHTRGCIKGRRFQCDICDYLVPANREADMRKHLAELMHYSASLIQNYENDANIQFAVVKDSCVKYANAKFRTVVPICPECFYVYLTKYMVAQHYNIIHNKNVQDCYALANVVQEVEFYIPTRNYICHQCPGTKKFKKQKDLTDHWKKNKNHLPYPEPRSDYRVVFWCLYCNRGPYHEWFDYRPHMWKKHCTQAINDLMTCRAIYVEKPTVVRKQLSPWIPLSEKEKWEIELEILRNMVRRCFRCYPQPMHKAIVGFSKCSGRLFRTWEDNFLSCWRRRLR